VPFLCPADYFWSIFDECLFQAITLKKRMIMMVQKMKFIQPNKEYAIKSLTSIPEDLAGK
jgi:hypothetical protein